MARALRVRLRSLLCSIAPLRMTLGGWQSITKAEALIDFCFCFVFLLIPQPPYFCFVMGKLFLLSKIFFDLRKGIAVAQDAAAVLEADEVHADVKIIAFFTAFALIIKRDALDNAIDVIGI